MKDILIVRGRNYFPQDIELCARHSHQQLARHRSAVFQSREAKLVVLQEISVTEEHVDYSQLGELIRSNIYSDFEINIDEVIFVRQKTIPLTTSGKLQRESCRLMYENSDFPYLAREQFQSSISPAKIVAESKNYIQPRDFIEFYLCEIVESVLGLKNISVVDNLIDYGIESVRIIELLEQINKKFNKDLPLSAVIDSPCIESLAEKIRQKGAEVETLPFVMLKKGGGKKTVFCIHTIGGNPFVYYSLSGKLPEEYSVYGIQAKGLEAEEKAHDSIEEMSTFYLEQIMKISPQSEIVLVAYSSAAIIAYELARRLQREKRLKSLLLFIDPISPTAIQNARTIDDVELQFRATLGEAMINNEDEWLKYWGNNSKAILAIRTEQERLSFLEKQLAMAPSAFFPNFGEQRLRRFLSTYMSLYKALLNFTPKGVFRGKIYIIRTDSDDNVLKEGRDQECIGWGKHSTEGAVVSCITGNHLRVLSEPTVSDVADIVKQWLA